MESKVCPKCKIEKLVEEFNKNKINKSGLNSWCKNCNTEYSRQYHINNLEKENKRRRQRYINNPEKDIKRSSQWRINHLEEAKKYDRQRYINNPEKEKERTRQWQINNPVKCNSRNSKRRAKIRNSTTEYVDLLQLYKNHKWVCGICGLKIDKKLKYPNSMSVSHDHIIPIAKGGGHIYDNIQPAHLVCNERKHIKIDNIQLKLQIA